MAPNLTIKTRLLRWLALPTLLIVSWWATTHVNLNSTYRPGDVVDRFNGVNVYYNGGVAHVGGRHIAPDGYDLGLRWQCVEFVKRYYYEHYHHRMPEPRGNAKEFLDKGIPSGAMNVARLASIQE